MIKRGDLVWLKPEIEDINNLGENVQNIKRPFLVISNNKNNVHSPTIQIAAVSKKIRKSDYPMHVLLKKEDYDCLRYDSIVLLEQVLTINKKFVQRKELSLSANDMKKVNKAIYIQMIDESLNIDTLIN